MKICPAAEVRDSDRSSVFDPCDAEHFAVFFWCTCEVGTLLSQFVFRHVCELIATVYVFDTFHIFHVTERVRLVHGTGLVQGNAIKNVSSLLATVANVVKLRDGYCPY